MSSSRGFAPFAFLDLSAGRRRQHTQQGTWRCGVAGTARDCLRKNAHQSGEIREFRLKLVATCPRDLSHVGTGGAGWLGERQQGADFPDAESNFVGPADEGQPANIGLFVGAVSARGSCGRRHELDALVIAHRLEIDARRRRELPNNQGFHGIIALAPVVATGCRMP
jgi:hypothetical protein